MGRPPSDLDDYLDWQERLASFRASGLSIDEFCLQEGVSRSTYHRWMDNLKDGIPKEMVAEKAAREKAESGQAAFVPITLKASPVEIELPNGGVVRLPLGVGQVVLVEVIRAVGALEPWAYVCDVLLRLHAETVNLEEMLPDRWAAAHPDAILTHRLEEPRARAVRTRARRAHRRARQK